MSAQDLATAASAAGFRGDALVMAIAIGLAEDGGNSTTSPPNDDGSVDRGPWQINSRWHAEVSDACAYDFACAARETYRISSGGSDWSQWATWTGGAYRAFLDQARALAGASLGSGAPVSTPTSAPGTGPRVGALLAFVAIAVVIASA